MVAVVWFTCLGLEKQGQGCVTRCHRIIMQHAFPSFQEASREAAGPPKGDPKPEELQRQPPGSGAQDQLETQPWPSATEREHYIMEF